MTKFKKLEITGILAEGFKGFKERTVITLETGKNTFVGDNGLGKSSIGELITWVLTGMNIQGKQKDLNILNKESLTVVGAITFVDEFGKAHEVERKVSTTTTLKFDKKRITQKQLDELIDTELFILIFNPLYFLSLDATNSRNKIYKLLPELTKEEVLAQLNSDERAFLEAEHFDIKDTNTYLVNRRKELNEIEDTAKYLKGYMSKLEESIEIPAPMTFDNKQIEDLEKKLQLVNEQKPTLKNLSDLLMKKSELDKKIAEISGKRFESEKVKLELLNQKTLLEQKIKTEMAKEYKQVDSSKLEKDIALLRNDYKNAKNQSATLELESDKLNKKQIHFHEGSQCPSCKQVITKEAVKVLSDELQKQVNEDKAVIQNKKAGFDKTMAQLEIEGKELLALITKAKKEDEDNQQKFEKVKQQTILIFQKESEEVMKKLSNLSGEEATFEKMKASQLQALYKEIEALQIHKLESENAQIQKVFNDNMQKERGVLQQAIVALRKEKEAVLQHESKRTALLKRAEQNAKELEVKKKEMETYKQKEAHINQQISYMKVFNSQKIVLINETLSKHLNKISLKLEKAVQSTGEIKDCFEVLFDNKELKICSTSETIKAGLEISHMMRELSGLDYPVFVDNGESITSYEDNSFQTIETRVVKDKKLSILKNGVEKEIVAEPTANLNFETTDEEEIA